QNTDGFSRIPTRAAGEVRKVPAVAVVSAVASGDGKVAGVGKQTIIGVDPSSITKVASIDWKNGSDSTLASLGADGTIMESNWGKDNGIKVGDKVGATTPTGKRVTYVVRGSARDEPSLLY